MTTETTAARPAPFTPSSYEDHWYAAWLAADCFSSTPDSRPPYVIAIPPPNVTGVLHMGHMLNNTIQDVLIRRRRSEGYNACWVPGTDHASIATEAKVVQLLRQQGIKKSDLGRDEFLTHAWAWKEKYGGIILEQLKKLGASCDWKRTRFTMEPALSRAVLKVFVDLYNKGYIYRGLRMVNWDPAGRTALSDEEVIYRETQGKLYHIRYHAPHTHKYLVIATTRPETLLADTAIAVHPDDPRFADWVGREVKVPLLDRCIPVIADPYVDREFGTGCLKVTPAHDPNDYALGQKHGLPIIDILNEDGSLNENCGLPAYLGLDRAEARKKIVHDLIAHNLLETMQDISHAVGYSERTDAVVEPRLSQQWWVRMQELAQPALKAVLEPDNEGVKLIPPKFVNTYRHWMENVKDWCISRQLWWGHRIPAWHLPSGEIVVDETAEAALAQARMLGYEGSAAEFAELQDQDVLDTWFSSWLWPISIFDGLEDGDKTDFKYYYPKHDLVTAPEILFFWVARMIIAGYEYAGQRPFRNVYLTGIVRDKLGRKMSKSLGNSPDPLDLIAQHGADSVRVGMLLCAPAGNDLLYDPALVEQGRNFANKLWNASKLLDSLAAQAQDVPLQPAEALALDWFEARMAQAAQELARQFEQFRISEALMTLYKLAWDDFCSSLLEMLKPGAQAVSAHAVARLKDQFAQLLLLLHPFTPFITEELWQRLALRAEGEFLTLQQLKPLPFEANNPALERMDVWREALTSLRNLRAEYRLPSREVLDVYVRSADAALWQQGKPLLEKMGHICLHLGTAMPDGSKISLVRTHELGVDLKGLTMPEDQQLKLRQEITYLEGFLESVRVKLSNEKFVQNAKPDLVEKERRKEQDALLKLEALRRQLAT